MTRPLPHLLCCVVVSLAVTGGVALAADTAPPAAPPTPPAASAAPPAAPAMPPAAAKTAPGEPKAASGEPKAVPAPNPKPAPPPGTSAVVVDLSSIESVIGRSVKSSAGEDMGRIVDLLVTNTGQVRAAVIDFGGILGVGSRKVAVDWKALDFDELAKGGYVRLALTRNQVRVSPEYKPNDPVVILEATRPEPEAAKAPSKPEPEAAKAPPKPAPIPQVSAPQVSPVTK